jgi:hypothetical protein
MWAIGLVVVALVVVYYSHLISKWKNPKIDGVLPPGSMGWPLIGETLQFIIPGRSLDLHPFVKKRMQKYVICHSLWIVRKKQSPCVYLLAY